MVRAHKVASGVLVALLTACSAGPHTLTVDAEAGSAAFVAPNAGSVTAVVVPPAVANTDSKPIAAPKLRSIDGRAPISLAFAGDTSFHNGLHLWDPLAEIAPLLGRPDFTIINLETAVAPLEVGRPPVDKQFLFRSDPVMVDQLAAAGVDAVTLANNHALDFGPAALESGLALLEQAGIEAVGGGVDAEAAYKPLIKTVGEWTVGIAAFSRVPCDWSWTEQNVREQVAWACPAFMDEADAVVAALVDDVDLAVVMVHGGTEGQLCPDETMSALNRHWSDLGVGLIVNSHPHVVQGVSSIGETIIVNSTGNFSFPPSFGLTANSALFLATLSEQGLFISVEPLVSEAGIVRAGTELRRQAILGQIDQFSTGWRVLSDGRVLQDNGWVGACQPNLEGP